MSAPRTTTTTGSLPERRRRPGAGLDAPRAVLWAPAVLSAAVLGLAVLATGAGADRRWADLVEVARPDALPGWWATVLYALVALACLLRARADAARGAGARAAGARRWRPPASAAAWAVLAALLTVLSADHVLQLHLLLAGDHRLAALPGVVADRPVQVALVLTALPVVAVLLAATDLRQRVLLVTAGLLYLVAAVVIDQGLLPLPGGTLREETLEVAFEWVGALVLLVAAMDRVRMAPDRVAAGRVAAPAPAPPPGSALLEAVAVVDRLRSPGGCPWDAEQTHASLAPFAVEEGHEVAEAAESGDPAALREELGDLLLQVVLHARIAAEHPSEPFDVDDVASALVAKLHRRHPHVFGPSARDGGRGADAAAVERSWEELKAAERGSRSAFDGVPAALPALARAQEVLARAERVDPALVPAAGTAPAGAGREQDLGEHLLGAVQAGRSRGQDAEAVLRAAVRELEGRARAREAGSAAPAR